MAGLGGIGAHEGALLIAVDDGGVEVAVEEDHGDVLLLSGVDHVLSGVGRGVLHDVDDQQVGAVGDGGVHLVHLGGLGGVAVIVGVLHAQGIQLLVQLGADGGDVHVGVVVVEHADVQAAEVAAGVVRRGVVVRGSGGLVRVIVRGRGGIVRLLAAVIAAAGSQRQHHGKRQEQSQNFLDFHPKFPPINMFHFRAQREMDKVIILHFFCREHGQIGQHYVFFQKIFGRARRALAIMTNFASCICAN